MRRFLSLIAATGLSLGIGLGIANTAHAQSRVFGAESFMMDDGSGHTYLIQAPGGMTGPVIYNMPLPPPGNPPAGFVNVGTATGQTLYWNNAVNHQDWEASNVLTNDGVSAVGVTGTLAVSGVSTLSNTLFVHAAATTVNGDIQSVAIRSTAPGSSWVGAGAFGGATSTVILGEESGLSQLGGHNANLSAWQNLYINAGGGNVRIGSVTLPTNTLDVAGTFGASGLSTLAALNQTGVANINTSGNAGTAIGNSGVGAGGINIESSGSVRVNTDATAGNTLIGNAGTVTVLGPTSINTTTGATTSIGTGGTGAVNIGNATGNTVFTGGIKTNPTTNVTNGGGDGETSGSLNWDVNAVGYAVGVLNTGGAVNADGLIAKTTGTAATNRIFTANSGAGNGTDRFTVNGDGSITAPGAFNGGAGSFTNLSASGTLGVTGVSTLGTVSAGAVSGTSFTGGTGSFTTLAASTSETFSNLTNGSVPYIGAAGLLSQNNANFFWDNTNTILDVGATGGAFVTAGMRVYAAANDVSGTHDAHQIIAAGDATHMLELGYNTTDGDAAIQSINQGFGATPLQLQPAGGNVGINNGGIAPTHTLEVTGTTNISGATTVGGTLGVTGAATFSSTGSFGGALNMNSNLINNVTDPISVQDAATKHYVDVTALGTAVILAPATTARNTVTPTADVVPLTLKNFAGGTADILDLKDGSGNSIASFSPGITGLTLGNSTGGTKQGILRLENSGGTAVYTIAPSGTIMDVNTDLQADGNINANLGALETAGTTRISNTGAATLTSINGSGAITFSGIGGLGVVHSSGVGALSSGLIATGDIGAGAVNLTSQVTGILPVANGGTGSNTQNFVDLTTAQSVGGAKTFTALTTANSFASSGAAITGGSINGTPVGATTPSTGAFTNLSASGTLGVTGASTLGAVSAGAVSGTSFTGGTGAFTTLAASTSETFSNFGTAGVVHNAAGGLLSSGPINLASNGAGGDVTGVLAVANGGTGSNTQNFVDLTTNQSVGGNKTFTGVFTNNNITGSTFNSTGVTGNVALTVNNTSTGTALAAVSTSGTALLADGTVLINGYFNVNQVTSGSVFLNLNPGNNTQIGNTTGTFSLTGSTNTILGTTNINTTGAAITNIGSGGTGAINIGNVTGGTTVTGPTTLAAFASAGVVHNAAGGLLSSTQIVNADISAGTITDASLATPGITVTAGTGLSGGGTFNLGGSTTLTNAGVLGVTGSGAGINVTAGQNPVVTNTGVTSYASNADVIYAAQSAATGAVSITPVLNTQTANTFFSGPSTAGPSTPTFRTLTAADITAAGTLTNNTSGTAATVTTDANLTGDVTSSGNATTIANTATAGNHIITAINAGSAATLNGSQVIPAFGAQNISTTGTLGAGAITGTSVAPGNMKGGGSITASGTPVATAILNTYAGTVLLPLGASSLTLSNTVIAGTSSTVILTFQDPTAHYESYYITGLGAGTVTVTLSAATTDATSSINFIVINP